MLILGLGDHVDCGSALINDGKVLAAVNDERLVREKMVFGIPRRSIEAVLRLAGASAGDIEGVAIGTINQHIVPQYTDFRGGWFGLRRSGFKKTLFDVGSKAARFRDSIPLLESAYYLVRKPAYANRRRILKSVLAGEFGIRAPVKFVDHHLCHAASAYYSSDFGPNATVFTIDGGGDGVSAKAYQVEGGRFTELRSVPAFDSLGAFYSYITQICGFQAGRHEGKITGLAAHGEPKYVDLLDSLLTFQDGGFRNVGHIFFHSALKEIERRLPAGWTREDLSASIQVHAERLSREFVRHWVARTGYRDVGLAGGVCANVRINQEIHELPEVDRCFVHAGMSDAGIGLGAALAHFYELHPDREPDTRCLDHVYLGPSYSDSQIGRALQQADVRFSRPDDMAEEVATLLSQGAVVARFDGRMEYGPRALGNRSILYQPTDRSVNDWLNVALKRTEFMPFAPSVLEEAAPRLFTGLDGAERTARFMTVTFNCTDWMRQRMPGVVHVDGTARPQTVRREDNVGYYDIIKAYERKTGLPGVINTSYNMHEEPIVCSPEDAIRAFKLGHLDYLAIGPYLARNPAPIAAGPRLAMGATAPALVESVK